MRSVFVLLGISLFVSACDSGSPATIPPRSTPFVGIPTTDATASTATIAPTSVATAAPINPTAAPTTSARSTPPALPSATPLPVAKPTSTGKGFDMRSVDWFKVVTTDPHLKYDASIQPPSGVQVGPYVTSKTNTNLAGHALVEKDRILFMDMSGDGQEEALISLYSGGTAGNLGLLIYTAINNTPTLADSLAGYKIGGVADGNNLKVTEPIYQGWEPNCCPSGFFVTRYRLQNNKLAQVSRDEQPIPEARKLTVDKFYELLQNRNYTDAYNNFLSPNYRSGSPYNQWLAGYANTVAFTYTTNDNPDGSVSVELVSTDKTASGNVTHHFVGTWRLVWYSTARFKQWVLDSASFREV